MGKQKALQLVQLQGLESGTPKETRTPNLLIRSQTSSPAITVIHPNRNNSRGNECL